MCHEVQVDEIDSTVQSLKAISTILNAPVKQTLREVIKKIREGRFCCQRLRQILLSKIHHHHLYVRNECYVKMDSTDLIIGSFICSVPSLCFICI